MPYTENLLVDAKSVNFWVWVDPSSWHVRHQITMTGSFVSGGLIEPRKSNLPFIINPEFQGDLSPFTMSVMNQYTTEYNFEINREHYFPQYPSRLNAIYLLQSESEAEEYRKRHMAHVGNRILKRVKSTGSYVYSTHDSSWVDFFRTRHTMDDQTIHDVTQAYWKGVNVEQCGLRSMGQDWTQSPIREVLYLGRVDFDDQAR